MRTVKKITGYTLAVLATPLVLATFIGMQFWAGGLANVTGVQVSAWYTGGEVKHIVNHGAFEARIHRPVFDGFLWERSEGFVQVDWAPLESVPPVLTEDVDVDNDGTRDFRVEFDREKVAARLAAQTDRVIGLEAAYKLRRSYAVRVLLRNE